MRVCGAVLLCVLIACSRAQVNTWQTDDPPTGTQSIREFHVAATLNGTLFVYGGVNLQQVLGDTWKYDYDLNEWQSVVSAVMPPARLAPAYAPFHDSGSLFMFGGLAGLQFLF